MSKLIKKETNVGSPVSLRDIATMVKNSEPEREMNEVEMLNVDSKTSAEQDEVREVQRKKRKSVLKETKFGRIVEEIEKREYGQMGVIYVDEEIREVLSLLKSKGKIKTSSLVSYILEQFLEENKDDINTVIKSANRFL
jgi:hypothetical protein